MVIFGVGVGGVRVGCWCEGECMFFLEVVVDVY